MTPFEGLARPVVVGHRGGRGPGWPTENTLVAFDRARAEGARAIETDVRTCASGEVVVFHDPTLARMTDGKDTRPVARVPLWELSRLPLGPAGERAPSLANLLDWAAARGMPLNVEIKHDVPDRLALARAVAGPLARCRVPLVVSCFDPFTLAAFGASAPRVPRALLTDKAQRYAPILHGVASALGRVGALSALHVHDAQATRASVAGWRARGLAVGVWTINDPTRARELASFGVDFLITDQPATIVAGLA